MSEPPPPAYAARPPSNPVVEAYPSSAPPQYSFPKSFVVGLRTIPPFVSSEDLKGHLALLHSFALLRSQVDELDVNASILQIVDKDRRWGCFVSLAVER